MAFENDTLETQEDTFKENANSNNTNSLMHLLDSVSPTEDYETIILSYSKYNNNISFKPSLKGVNSDFSILSLESVSSRGKIWTIIFVSWFDR